MADDVRCRAILVQILRNSAQFSDARLLFLCRCTKFAAWRLGDTLGLKRVVFLDADTLPLAPIDSLIDHPSAFAAAPDAFPPDQFNSGVFVLTPSAARYAELVQWNAERGTAEGGDQCLLNDFFGEWFYASWDDKEQGRLPWMMNVPAASHATYRTLMRMQSRDEPAVVHFVGGEAKPWHLLVLRYQGREEEIPVAVRRLQSAWEQLYWLAKTPKVCAGLSDAERAEMRRLLDAV